jgi:hypothetical protein
MTPTFNFGILRVIHFSTPTLSRHGRREVGRAARV